MTPLAAPAPCFRGGRRPALLALALSLVLASVSSLAHAVAAVPPPASRAASDLARTAPAPSARGAAASPVPAPAALTALHLEAAAADDEWDTSKCTFTSKASGTSYDLSALSRPDWQSYTVVDPSLLN